MKNPITSILLILYTVDASLRNLTPDGVQVPSKITPDTLREMSLASEIFSDQLLVQGYRDRKDKGKNRVVISRKNGDEYI
eukprot:11478866-Prorocentrum_lima.AAC.1